MIWRAVGLLVALTAAIVYVESVGRVVAVADRIEIAERQALGVQ